ncbi:hypothetical protein Adt_00444 [Abeliophyllum distichum]|uniref:Uncharacterized protein n=1 Tax=Abeliophyllum distichum TaxID=126358 RepID=A0ABD1VQE1_9LAMI
MEEDDYSSVPRGETAGRIIRRSIFTFLQKYHYFTSTAALLAFPFAASTLLSQAFLPSSLLLTFVQRRLRSLFLAAGFPPSSELFIILNLKLSQTIVTYILLLPFSFSFLLIAKASIIKSFSNHKPAEEHTFSSWISLYKPLFHTQICNSLVILSANATCFSLIFFAFNCFDVLGISSPGAVLFVSATGAVVYSIILANAYIICNLALVLSGVEKRGGYLAILKACVLIQGRTATALSLAVPINMGLAAVEALFQYRIVTAYRHALSPNSSMAFEAMFIAYLYSILLVLDTIVGCIFFKSCKTAFKIDQEDGHSIQIQIEDTIKLVGSFLDLPFASGNWQLLYALQKNLVTALYRFHNTVWSSALQFQRAPSLEDNGFIQCMHAQIPPKSEYIHPSIYRFKNFPSFDMAKYRFKIVKTWWSAYDTDRLSALSA